MRKMVGSVLFQYSFEHFLVPSMVEIVGAVAAGGGDAGIVVKFGIAVSASTPCT